MTHITANELPKLDLRENGWNPLPDEPEKFEIQSCVREYRWCRWAWVQHLITEEERDRCLRRMTTKYEHLFEADRAFRPEYV